MKIAVATDDRTRVRRGHFCAVCSYLGGKLARFWKDEYRLYNQWAKGAAEWNIRKRV